MAFLEREGVGGMANVCNISSIATLITSFKHCISLEIHLDEVIKEGDEKINKLL